jgi:hypothetical protein
LLSEDDSFGIVLFLWHIPQLAAQNFWSLTLSDFKNFCMQSVFVSSIVRTLKLTMLKYGEHPECVTLTVNTFKMLSA